MNLFFINLKSTKFLINIVNKKEEKSKNAKLPLTLYIEGEIFMSILKPT